MALEPSGSMRDHGLQRTRFWKEMARAGNDFQRLQARQPRQRLLIQFDHADIGTADDQKSWRSNQVQGTAGKIRSTAARHDSADALRKLRRRRERGSRPGAGAE